MAAAGQDQGVDHAVESERRTRGALELGIDEAEVEGRVVGDQLGIADEGQELVGDILEERLVLQELGGQAVHGHRVTMDIALGIEVAMELAARGNTVDDLDAAELDQPVAVDGVEPRRLRVEDDLAQHWRFPMRYASTDCSLSPLAGRGSGYAQNLAKAVPWRPFERFDQLIDLEVGVGECAAGVHNEIRTRALVGIGHLAGQHLLELLQRHAGTPQHALALHVGGRADDDDRIDTRRRRRSPAAAAPRSPPWRRLWRLRRAGMRARPRAPGDGRWLRGA